MNRAKINQLNQTQMPETFHYCSTGVTVTESTPEGLHPTATQFRRSKKEKSGWQKSFHDKDFRQLL
jgi:hypothetical protein